MAKRRRQIRLGGPLGNQRRISFAEFLSGVNRRAHEQADRGGGGLATQSIRAVIAAADQGDDDDESVAWMWRLGRWVLAMGLLPLCWVTMWTLLLRFEHATLEQNFWLTAEFWYFSTGVFVMAGWFWSGLLHTFFLYLYVLGHELTHAVFVVIFCGEVRDIHVSTQGGYITTNKTNWVIALSPYVVPFWAVVGAVVYGVLRALVTLAPAWDLGFYALIGATWMFHLVWTLWMLPRDQPDLKQNGTFLSLVVIFLCNLLVLVILLCVAAKSPMENMEEFAMTWLRQAATWGDFLWRTAMQMIAELRTAGKF